jgi:hypothetical protein
LNKTSRARYAAPLALALLAGAAHAAPFGFFDPRSAAMGGTGVSAGNSDNASFLNPALLSLPREGERFGLNLPIVSVHAADPDKLLDDVDKLKSAGDSLTNAINAFNAAIGPLPNAPLQAASGQLATALDNFRTELNKVSSKALTGDLFAAAITVAVPGKNLGFGAHAAARADVGAEFIYASSDNAFLTNLSSLAGTYATSGNAGDLNNLLTSSGFGTGTQITDPTLNSQVKLRGLVQEEIGVSFAHQFASLGDTAIGVTPKQVKYITLDYVVSPQHANITIDQGKKEYSGSNLDFGVAKELGSGFRAGLVGKNMVKKSFTTALGNQIELKPQYRAGISHHTGWTTVAIDLDLTKNDPIGLEKATQFAAIGAEFDLLGWLQLRVGYRSDRTGNYKGLPSAGIGIALFKSLHIDAAIAARGKEEAMAAVQLGLRF